MLLESDMKLTVKAARINAGKTQDEAADIIGIPLNTYKSKETGRSRFYVDEIAALAKAWNLKVENFFEAECRKKTQKEAV